MSQPSNLTRRKIIQAMAGVPLMPFASLGAATGLLSACGDMSDMTSITFNGFSNPISDADRATVFTSATVDYTTAIGGTKLAQPLSYKVLYKTGDVLKRPDTGADVVAGGYYKLDGVTPIMDTSVSGSSEQFYSDCPDGTSLIKLDNPTVPGITGNTLFLVTQFEYKTKNNAGTSMYGLLPSPIGIATLQQNTSTGELTVKNYYNVPTADAHGLWITCAGSISPWNTHLSSEEYEPDAWVVHNNTAGSVLTQFLDFSKYTFGDTAPTSYQTATANPYHYGHVPEVTVLPNGTGTLKKHYCMGRISRELVQVMPDNRTVLMGDDATAGGIFMFIADVAGNLSSGKLYAAKVTQTSATNGGTFVLEWILLGQATSAEIENLANTLKATDIMSVLATTTTSDTTGYTKIKYGTSEQWFKVNTGKEKAAAFLETRRYAAKMGATMEFTKFEGVTLNAKDKKAYFAMSAIRDTMTTESAKTSGDDIKLTKVSAGAVFEVSLGLDSSIGSEWVPKSMWVPTPLLGSDLSATDSEGNTAVIDKIANPDNVKYSEAMRTLFIGEDSGMHLNNYVWAYSVSTGKLSRILSVPAGAECVCLCPVDNVNNRSYLFAGFQHAGDWTFLTPAQDGLKAAVAANWGGLIKKSAVGYVSGLPMLA